MAEIADGIGAEPVEALCAAGVELGFAAPVDEGAGALDWPVLDCGAQANNPTERNKKLGSFRNIPDPRGWPNTSATFCVDAILAQRKLTA